MSDGSGRQTRSADHAGEAEVAEDMFGTLSFKEEVSKSRDFPETDIPVEEKELEESYVEQESVESISSPQVNI